MNIFYCIPENTSDMEIAQSIFDRSSYLACSLLKGDPTGKITVFPSVVIKSTFVDDFIFSDDKGQVTLEQVQVAIQKTTDAEANFFATEKTNFESAKTKLASIGLTENEITALFNSLKTNSFALPIVN